MPADDVQVAKAMNHDFKQFVGQLQDIWRRFEYTITRPACNVQNEVLPYVQTKTK